MPYQFENDKNIRQDDDMHHFRIPIYIGKDTRSVSYTHLDVYKRQSMKCLKYVGEMAELVDALL